MTYAKIPITLQAMPTDQLTLDLPETRSHGVVVEHGQRIERFAVSSEEGAKRVAERVRKARTSVTWDDAPKPSGWYGIAPGGVICRIAAY